MTPKTLRKYRNDPVAFMEGLTIPSAKGVHPFRQVMAGYQRQWFRDVAPSLLAIAAGEKPPIGRFWCERTKGASKDSDAGLCLLWLLAFSPRRLDMQVAAADRDQAYELKKAITDVLYLEANDWLNTRIDVKSWAIVNVETGSELNIVATDTAGGAHGSR